MTPEDRHRVLLLCNWPDDRKISPKAVLRHFGTSNGGQLAYEQLLDARDRRDAEDVEMSMLLGFVFEFVPDHLALLVELLAEDWHRCHEDIVLALVKFRSTESLRAFYAAAQWVPKHLEFDEFRGLARKAVHGIGALPGAEAEGFLVRLLGNPDPLVVKYARKRLARRQERRIRLEPGWGADEGVDARESGLTLLRQFILESEGDGPEVWTPFSMATTAESLSYLDRIALEMVLQFDISISEARGRVEIQFATCDFTDYTQETYLLHEEPDSWARRIYFGMQPLWWRPWLDDDTRQPQPFPPSPASDAEK